MTGIICNTTKTVLVAIDIAKSKHDVAVLLPDGKKRSFKVANTREDFEKFSVYLKDLHLPCLVGFEATGNYHQPIAYFLQKEGFLVCLISSLPPRSSLNGLARCSFSLCIFVFSKLI